MHAFSIIHRMLKNTKIIYLQMMIHTHRCKEQNTNMHEYVLSGLNET
jgi:hypothetical protein